MFNFHTTEIKASKMEEKINDLIKSVEALVYYSQIHTIKGVSPVNMPDHESAWKAAQQWLWDNCKANEMGNYSLKTKTQPGAVWVKGAPKERKFYHARFKGHLSDLVHDGVIEPVKDPEYWQATASGTRISIKDSHIIEYLNESPAEQPVVDKQDWSNYIPQMSNIQDRTGISIEWQKVWAEVENWYGDIKKKETGEQFLKRIQATYFTGTAEQPGREVEAVEFARWILEKNYKPYAGEWYLNGNHVTHHPRSTNMLYQEFKQHPAEWSRGKEK